jgi:hypothetical protein
MIFRDFADGATMRPAELQPVRKICLGLPAENSNSEYLRDQLEEVCGKSPCRSPATAALLWPLESSAPKNDQGAAL